MIIFTKVKAKRYSKLLYMNKKGIQRCWTEVTGMFCNPRRHDTELTNEFFI